MAKQTITRTTKIKYRKSKTQKAGNKRRCKSCGRYL